MWLAICIPYASAVCICNGLCYCWAPYFLLLLQAAGQGLGRLLRQHEFGTEQPQVPSRIVAVSVDSYLGPSPSDATTGCSTGRYLGMGPLIPDVCLSSGGAVDAVARGVRGSASARRVAASTDGWAGGTAVRCGAKRGGPILSAPVLQGTPGSVGSVFRLLAVCHSKPLILLLSASFAMFWKVCLAAQLSSCFRPQTEICKEQPRCTLIGWVALLGLARGRCPWADVMPRSPLQCPFPLVG